MLFIWIYVYCISSIASFSTLNFFLLTDGQGLKFSDLMYVTKRNMTAAVTNLTKSLETVKEAVVVSFCFPDFLFRISQYDSMNFCKPFHCV